MELGKRFRHYRMRAGLRQNEAAELMGIKNYQLGNYETDRSEPNIDILKKMSKIYGVSVDALIGNNVPRNKHASEQQEEDNKFSGDELAKLLSEFVEEYERRKM